MVEPVDPFQRCKLDLLDVPPGTVSANDFGFVEPVDGLGQSIVVGISHAPDRGLDAGGLESLGVVDRQILLGFNGSSQHSKIGELRWRRTNDDDRTVQRAH